MGVEAGGAETTEELADLFTSFPFWLWIFSNRLLLPSIMDDTFLPALQTFYEIYGKDISHYVALAMAATWSAVARRRTSRRYSQH
jgi:hypothetical protein